MMKASMSPEERLLWRLRKANRKADILHQRLKKYELEEDPEPIHDPELITPEQLHALKKIGYKNRNYVPVGRRGVYGGVVQNMHMHWKKHETVQVDCHTFKRPEIRPIARELARLSGGIVIDIHQGTTIIMYRGRNYKQPKGEMIPLNTLSKRKALFKSKYLQSLEGINKNIEEIQFELRALRRKAKERESQEGEDVTNHEDEATNLKHVGEKGRPSQIVDRTSDEKSATAELSEDSSEEDDDVFSWDSDSLDEEDLSDNESDYKKADDIQHSREIEDDKKGKVSSKHRNKVSESDEDSVLEEDTDTDTDGAHGIKMVEGKNQKQVRNDSRDMKLQKKGSQLHSRGAHMQDDMTDFGYVRDNMREKHLPFRRNEKGQGLINDVPKKRPKVFKDDILDDSEDTESGLSERYTDDKVEELQSHGNFSSVQMSAKNQRNTSIGKRQEQFKSGEKAKFEPDDVLEESSDMEENGNNEELEGFESEIEQDEFDNDTEVGFEDRKNTKEGKPGEDWVGYESKIGEDGKNSPSKSCGAEGRVLPYQGKGGRA